MCSTTPRKRSPRAIGEVYVSSASTVYLNPVIEQQLKSSADIVDPIYENAPPVPQRNRRTPQQQQQQQEQPSASQPLPPPLQFRVETAFSRCRISLPVGIGSGWKTTGATEMNECSAAVDVAEQCITSFIGENDLN